MTLQYLVRVWFISRPDYNDLICFKLQQSKMVFNYWKLFALILVLFYTAAFFHVNSFPLCWQSVVDRLFFDYLKSIFWFFFNSTMLVLNNIVRWRHHLKSIIRTMSMGNTVEMVGGDMNTPLRNLAKQVNLYWLPRLYLT